MGSIWKSILKTKIKTTSEIRSLLYSSRVKIKITLICRPLVYCWRGGQRSRSLAIILKEIGFQPTVVRGGYKEYRRMVRSSLFDLSPAATLAQFRLVRVSGATGSGKSQLLEALRARGEQVLHLEQLARHKGSVLGQYPG